MTKEFSTCFSSEQ